MNKGFSCKGCTERHPGYHDACEKYKKEKEEHNKAMKEYEKSKNPLISKKQFLGDFGRKYSDRFIIK